MGETFQSQLTARGSDPLSTPELMRGLQLAQGTQKAQQELSLGESVPQANLTITVSQANLTITVSQANLTITEHIRSPASLFSDPTDRQTFMMHQPAGCIDTQSLSKGRVEAACETVSRHCLG